MNTRSKGKGGRRKDCKRKKSEYNLPPIGCLPVCYSPYNHDRRGRDLMLAMVMWKGK